MQIEGLSLAVASVSINPLGNKSLHGRGTLTTRFKYRKGYWFFGLEQSVLDPLKRRMRIDELNM